MRKKRNPYQYIGVRYNNLVVISFVGYVNGRARVLAICDCGKEKEMVLNDLKTGNTKSCGCIKEVKNGLSHHPLHHVWVHVVLRCCDPTNERYAWYGGSGVKICDEWRDNFMAFYTWAIDKWKPGLQLDKDKLSSTKPGLLYSPDFCCFITSSENCRNKSNNVMITYNGETLCLTQWAERLNIPYTRLRMRINRGWNVERAFLEPVKKATS
jgi:hypothetical protein